MGVSAGGNRTLMHVLLVEAPGNRALRIGFEAVTAAAGHVLAIHPAESDVLLVCGTPGPELHTVIDRVWDQMPYPKHRATLTSPDEITAVLTTAQKALADRGAQRSAARENTIDHTDGQDLDDHEPDDEHSDHEHPDDEHSSHEHPDDVDHADADESMHDHGMTMGGHEHMSMDHMSMSGPGGYPLADGADDRDGLEMDVLHRRLGPVLPAWPAGVVLDVTLAGDTITVASAAMVDADADVNGDDHGPMEPGNVASIALDQAAQVLAVAGWDAAAARTLRIRDLAATGRRDQARERIRPLHRRIERSVMLRWSLRGLQVRPGVDVRTVLLGRLERADAALNGRRPEPEPATTVDEIPALVEGRDMGSARLVVAALTVHPGRRTDTTHQAGTAKRHHHG